MTERAIAFDFDGTLLDTGLDKGVHVLYAAWVVCYHHGYRQFLHPDDPIPDIERMLAAYCLYPGAPRFEQLSAVVNAAVTGRTHAISDPGELNLETGLAARYEEIRRAYNVLYSSLNDTAARMYWRPFPSVKSTLAQLSGSYDLFIASGVVQDLLDLDFALHQFEHGLFCGIFGSDHAGTRNKGVVLSEITARGYRDVLFVGDSTKDQEYAVQAGVRFLRIKDNEDFNRMAAGDPFDLPDDKNPWTFTPDELQFFRDKTAYLLRAFCSGDPLGNREICEWINR